MQARETRWSPLLLAWLATAVAGQAPEGGPPDLAARVAAIVAAPDIVHRTRLDLPCSWRTWEALVARPALVGQLWQAYGFGPAYQVTETAGVIHVVDPTGLVGDVYVVATDGRQRQYLALGQVDHWAVPFLNAGAAVFTLALEPGAATVAGELTVHVQAGSAVAGFVLRLGEAVLRDHVAHRIDLNLQDARTLFGAVETAPDQVRRRAGPEAAAALDAALGLSPSTRSDTP